MGQWLSEGPCVLRSLEYIYLLFFSLGGVLFYIVSLSKPPNTNFEVKGSASLVVYALRDQL